ncbi:MAG: Tol-Pal system beta propeller repeat protein TolB [Beggiatoa sp. IS2]|nr:MAG: Tol-Pal system beta propeller repeat protein TolB [Beggiatoa sp. IS2]
MMIRLFLLLLGFIAYLPQAYAILTIEVTGGQEGGGQPIAIIPFGQQAGMPTPPQDIVGIISNDLYRTGRFSPLPIASLPSRPFEASQIDFPSWQAVGVPHIVIGRIAGGATSGYTVEFELFDTSGGRLAGLSYKATAGTLRQVAHQISDAIYKALTGQRGIFGTRIAYVTVKRGIKQSIYKLYIADADGANPQMMLQSAEPIFSPSWSPDGRSITYVSLEGKHVAVYIQDVNTGKREKVAAWPGLNTAPSWSPDGSRLALSLSKDGNPEIYILNLRNRGLTRLTYDPAIDTEPSWSPDGQAIVFTSDRSGGPQIYQMSASGGNLRRLTFEGNYNTTAKFAPDGHKVVYLRGGSGYRIANLDIQNGESSIISRTSTDKSPSYAPNGSMIIYSNGGGLASISADGRVQQRLSVDNGEEVREPAWSPFSD